MPNYRSFCQSQPGLPVFFQDWYLDAACPDGEWSAATVERGGEVKGVMTYFLKRKMGFRYITMPGFVKFMGPWLANPGNHDLSEQHQLLADLLDQLPAVDGIRLDLHYSVTNWLPFYWRGFQQTTRYTYLLDLGDLDAIYHGINRNMRRNIRKAQQSLRLVESDDPERFYGVNQMSFARQGLRAPYAREAFLIPDAALATQGRRRIFFAEDKQGKTHSAAYLIWDDRSAYYHLSGDDPALRHSGSGIFLVWEAIRYSQEVLGLEIFDFEGSMIPAVEAIRRQFGARQMPYSSVWMYPSRVFAMVDGVKRFWADR